MSADAESIMSGLPDQKPENILHMHHESTKQETLAFCINANISDERLKIRSWIEEKNGAV